MQKYQRYIEIVGNVHASHLEDTLDNEKIEVHLHLLTLSVVCGGQGCIMAKVNTPEELDFINRSCRQSSRKSRKPNAERSDGIGMMRLAPTCFGKGDVAFRKLTGNKSDFMSACRQMTRCRCRARAPTDSHLLPHDAVCAASYGRMMEECSLCSCSIVAARQSRIWRSTWVKVTSPAVPSVLNPT